MTPAAWGAVSHVDGPGAHFLHASGEVGLQAQQAVARVDQHVETGFSEAGFFQEYRAFLRKLLD